MLEDGQVDGDEMVRTVRDVPADLERPGDDRFAEMGGRRTERRRRERERPLPGRPGLEDRRDRGLHERVLDEQPAVALHPALGVGDIALAVAVVDGLADLVQAEADEAQDRAAGVDPLVGLEGDRAGDRPADDDRSIERERAADRTVARRDELIGPDAVQRMAPLPARQPAAVDGVERFGRRPRNGRRRTRCSRSTASSDLPATKVAVRCYQRSRPHSAARPVMARISSPYFSRRPGPIPFTRRRAGIVSGRASAIASSVASWAMT